MTLFTSSARVAVLRVFMLDPVREYYQRQLETATALPIRAVQRELERLTEAGLLYRRLEGNRTYYRVDTQFVLFPELRSMVLKSVEPVERLRGLLSMEETVRLLFHNAVEDRVLLVTVGGVQPAVLEELWPFGVDVISVDEFVRLLGERREELEIYLVRGVDLLGRREDLLWRRIEAAGYAVEKGTGVA